MMSWKTMCVGSRARERGAEMETAMIKTLIVAIGLLGLAVGADAPKADSSGKKKQEASSPQAKISDKEEVQGKEAVALRRKARQERLSRHKKEQEATIEKMKEDMTVRDEAKAKTSSESLEEKKRRAERNKEAAGGK